MADFLCGEYRHQIDEKGRMRIPNKLKQYLDENSVVTLQSNHLVIYSGAEFTKIVEKLKNVPLSDIKAQKTIRLLFASTYELTEDGQGRTLVNQLHRTKAKIDKDIVFIGFMNKVEIWASEEYDLYLESNDENPSDFSNLREYGI